MKTHCLGPNNIDNQAMAMETSPQNLSYDGETRRWNFERHVHKHKEHHTALEGSVPHGHAGEDARSKVRHLNNGFQEQEEASLDSGV